MNQQSSLWSDAWRRLLANKAAVAGGLVLLILIVLAIFGILIVLSQGSAVASFIYTIF